MHVAAMRTRNRAGAYDARTTLVRAVVVVVVVRGASRSSWWCCRCRCGGRQRRVAAVALAVALAVLVVVVAALVEVEAVIVVVVVVVALVVAGSRRCPHSPRSIAALASSAHQAVSFSTQHSKILVLLNRLLQATVFSEGLKSIAWIGATEGNATSRTIQKLIISCCRCCYCYSSCRY